MLSHLVVCDPHGLSPTRLLCSWDYPGKNNGVGCHFLLEGIFLTLGSNPCLLCLLHWQADTEPSGKLLFRCSCTYTIVWQNDAEAETPGLWPPHAKNWLIGKDFDAGRDWGQEKGTTEDEMAGWHHWLDGSESEWTPGVGDGQGGLACCDSWGCKESDTTEWLNWTDDYLRPQPYGEKKVILRVTALF